MIDNKEVSAEEMKAAVDADEVSVTELALVSDVSISSIYKIFRKERVKAKLHKRVVGAFLTLRERSKASA